MEFDYLIEKIANAPMQAEPFAHLSINDFFSAEHLAALRSTEEIAIHDVRDDAALFEALFAQGWKIISFPGCITDHKAYMRWHKDKLRQQAQNNSACEGFGVTLRLVEPRAAMLKALSDFMASEPFTQALAARFGIALAETHYDGGIQKYLDGYEISPHPDIRRKALTYMVNINPAEDSPTQEHHTHYLRFKPAYQYVERYWQGHRHEDRCWVPWHWCETVCEQRENNSIVVFAPGNNTMHGVKASYNHLAYQRTQLYGNLWYHENLKLPMADWEDLEIRPGAHRAAHTVRPSLQQQLVGVLPAPVKQVLRRVLGSRAVHYQVRDTGRR